MCEGARSAAQGAPHRFQSLLTCHFAECCDGIIPFRVQESCESRLHSEAHLFTCRRRHVGCCKFGTCLVGATCPGT